MESEQAFEEMVDTEHPFVLEYERSEHVFGQGDAMSVALELEYEAIFPRLRVVPEPPRRMPSARVQHRRVIVVVAALALLMLLALPIRVLGGSSVVGAGPAVGQVYVVRAGDTLASIARQVAPANEKALVQRLATEAGSSTIVPGEHLLIP